MLVSHRYRFIFLKTRKTAGSSIELAFEPYARPEGWSPPEGDLSFKTEAVVNEAGIIGARGREAKKGAPFIDHVPAQRVRKRLPRRVWNDYFKFCTIRNPWDKTVSYFHYAHKAVHGRPSHVIVEKFREWLETDRHLRARDRPITWIGDDPITDGHIRYHRLEEDAAAIAEHLGITEPLKIGGIHTEFRNSDKLPYVDYYDDTAREIVARSFADEIEYYGWNFDNTAEVWGPIAAPRKTRVWSIWPFGKAPRSGKPAAGRKMMMGAAGNGSLPTNE